ERLITLAREQRCSLLEVSSTGGRISVSGLAPSRPDWDGFLRQAGATRGIRLSPQAVEFLPAFAELGWIDGALDPDVLTIGFARRLATYKRLNLLLQDAERAIRLIGGDRPIQVLLGRSIAELRGEGALLVMMENGQTVFHFTVARRSPTAGVRSGRRPNASRSDTGGRSDSSAPSRPGSLAAMVRTGFNRRSCW
ncbi:MAG: hypothetical protein ACLGI6_23495, partial [Gammaproteobacteria bacterium]